MAVKFEPLVLAPDVEGLVEVEYDLPIWPTFSGEMTEEQLRGDFLPHTTISPNDAPARGIIEVVDEGSSFYTMDCRSASFVSEKPREMLTYHAAAPDSNVIREATSFVEYESSYSSILRRPYGIEIFVPTKVGRVGVVTPYLTLAQRRYLIQMERRQLKLALNIPLERKGDVLVAFYKAEALVSMSSDTCEVHLISSARALTRYCTCMLGKRIHRAYDRGICAIHSFTFRFGDFLVGWKAHADIHITPTRLRVLADLSFERKRSTNLVGYAYGPFRARLDGTPMGRHPAYFPFIPAFHGFNLGYAGRTLDCKLTQSFGHMALIMQGFTFLSGFPNMWPFILSHVTGYPEDILKHIFLYLLYYELFLPFIPVRSQSMGRWVPPYGQGFGSWDTLQLDDSYM
jgi:hypothetical protein